MRLALVVFTLIATSPAPTLPTCLEIEPFVLMFGEPAVIRWAEKHGYSSAQIETMRHKCLRRDDAKPKTGA